MTRSDSVDHNRTPRGSVDLNGHHAPGDEEDGAGILALAKKQGTLIEAHDRGRLRQERKRPLGSTCEKSVLAQELVYRLASAGHDSRIMRLTVSVIDAPSVARIAAASSVMSMPTGHHARHLPQPTQPDSSN